MQVVSKKQVNPFHNSRFKLTEGILTRVVWTHAAKSILLVRITCLINVETPLGIKPKFCDKATYIFGMLVGFAKETIGYAKDRIFCKIKFFRRT